MFQFPLFFGHEKLFLVVRQAFILEIETLLVQPVTVTGSTRNALLVGISTSKSGTRDLIRFPVSKNAYPYPILPPWPPTRHKSMIFP